MYLQLIYFYHKWETKKQKYNILEKFVCTKEIYANGGGVSGVEQIEWHTERNVSVLWMHTFVLINLIYQNCT